MMKRLGRDLCEVYKVVHSSYLCLKVGKPVGSVAKIRIHHFCAQDKRLKILTW